MKIALITDIGEEYSDIIRNIINMGNIDSFIVFSGINDQINYDKFNKNIKVTSDFNVPDTIIYIYSDKRYKDFVIRNFYNKNKRLFFIDSKRGEYIRCQK